jgi:predicted component of type VI protein secretion system
MTGRKKGLDRQALMLGELRQGFSGLGRRLDQLEESLGERIERLEFRISEAEKTLVEMKTWGNALKMAAGIIAGVISVVVSGTFAYFIKR